MESNGLFPQEKDKQIVSPREFIMRYIKYLPIILISLAVALVVAKIYLRYSIPIYGSSAKLLIKREASRGGNDKFDDIFMMGGSYQNISNEIAILQSRPLAMRVARLLNLDQICYNKGSIRNTLLYQESPFVLQIMPPYDSTNFGIELTVVSENEFKLGDKAGQTYRFGQQVKQGQVEFTVLKIFPQVYNLYASNDYVLSKVTLDQAADRALGGLGVGANDNTSQIINLSFQSENPNLAVDILNALMAVYRESNIEDKKQMRISTLEFIDERLDTLRSELGIVEQDITTYMETRRAFDLEKQSELYFRNLEQESNNLVQQQVKITVIDWLIRYLNNGANIYRAVPVDLGTQEPSLLPFITQYNQLQQERQNALLTMPEANPFIQGLDVRLNKLRSDLIEGLRNVRQSYLIAENSISKQNQQTEGALQSIPSKGRQLAEKSRQQKIKEELYLFLLQKKEETAIASASTVSDSRIVEPARASYSAIKPNRKSIYTTAILLGLIIPGAFIFLREFLNDKVNSRTEIAKVTDAPFLGEIGHAESSETLVVNNSRQFISEQFRMMRTNLNFILGNVEKPVIQVTSSFSGEGKSFMTSNLAAVIALTGKRTVVLELDIRKPKVAANLGIKQRVGITNYIVGKASLEQLAVPVPGREDLFVIPCGLLPPNPAEQLLHERLEEVIAYARRNFDYVLIDTAPVGLVSDAVILGKYADATLVIIRQGYTYKRQLEMIDELYKQKKLPKVCLVLNDVRPEKGYGGYYGYGTYGYGYGGKQSQSYFDKPGNSKKGWKSWLLKTRK